MRRHGLAGIPYGHFGDGCVHLRLDFPLDRPGGRAVLREFLREAAELVTGYGGSLSGEHGDGRTRSELLPVMYSAAAIELFGRVKEVFDPAGVLNPGVLVRPRPLDADIRVRPAPRPGARPGRRGGSGSPSPTTAATSRWPCTAAPAWASAWPARPAPAGSCARPTRPPGTRRTPPGAGPGSSRRWSTAAREVVTGGWRAPEVREALDLCLSCKACSAECPAGVDMAAYKAEVLHQAYRGRPGPAATTRSASCRAGPGWPRGCPGWPTRRWRHRAWAGRPGWRRALSLVARCRRSRPSRSAPGTGGRARRAAGPGPGPVARCCCSSTPSLISSPRRSGRPRSGCWPTPGSP